MSFRVSASHTKGELEKVLRAAEEVFSRFGVVFSRKTVSRLQHAIEAKTNNNESRPGTENWNFRVDYVDGGVNAGKKHDRGLGYGISGYV